MGGALIVPSIPVKGSKFASRITSTRRAKSPVRVVATANVVIATLGDGDVQDGVTLDQNDRIMLTAETAGEDNGIYDVGPAGGPSVRSPDFDENVEVFAGVQVFVNEGTAERDTTWILATDDPIVVGTTALNFIKEPVSPHTHTRADLPSELAYEDEGNSYTETQIFSKNIDMGDQDATPVANRTWRVIDGRILATDTSSVEGRNISKESLEQITNAEVDAAAGILESKLTLNFATHAENHAARHGAATGADALATAAAGAIAIGDAASAGVAETFARSDHRHSLASPGAPANVTKDISDEGSSGVPARADHKHDISTAAPGAIAIGDAAAEGVALTLARSDHRHSLAAPAAPVNVTKAAAVAGTAPQAARADHKHDIDAAAPPTIGTANAEGSATSLARSDHVHDHGAQTVGTHHAAAAPAGTSGFMTGADKTKLDDLSSQAINTVSTTDATVTTIATIPIADDSVNILDVRCLARRTSVAEEAAGYVRRAIIFRQAAGVATLLGSQDPQLTREDDNQWDFNIVVSGNNALLQVTGRATRNIDWKSFHELRTIT